MNAKDFVPRLFLSDEDFVRFGTLYEALRADYHKSWLKLDATARLEYANKVLRQAHLDRLELN